MKLGELIKEFAKKSEPDFGPEFAEIEIGGICTHSARVRQGDLFVCLCGMHRDGHDCAAEAVANGAAAIVAMRGHPLPALDVPILRVRNTRKTLAWLCAAFYRHPERRLTLVGITGTNGKTTVSHMLYAILREAGVRCACIGTLGVLVSDRVAKEGTQGVDFGMSADPLANMTTPDPERLFALLAALADAGVTHVIMEISSHALALCKVSPLYFRVGVFTNLSAEHLDMHGNMEAYFAAKATLFAACDIGIFYTGDAYGRRLYDMPGKRCQSLSCSSSFGADYTATDAVYTPEGVRYRLLSASISLSVCCPVPGVFTVPNSMLAIASALRLGISAEICRQALAGFAGAAGRMERVPLPGADFSVLIDYAHTPDALEKLLLSVRQIRRRGQRILLLFGCGGDRDRTKRRRMGQIASALADFLIITSDNSRTEDPDAIIEEIIGGIDREKPYTVLPDRGEAIRYAVSVAEHGDILLLAGKGHEQYEINQTGRHPFNERDSVLAAWKLRGG